MWKFIVTRTREKQSELTMVLLFNVLKNKKSSSGQRETGRETEYLCESERKRESEKKDVRILL